MRSSTDACLYKIAHSFTKDSTHERNGALLTQMQQNELIFLVIKTNPSFSPLVYFFDVVALRGNV
jgi:hypothetical protein